ncbi:hypothetical protein [Burkholderia anthina]|uniref:hypothetical protein n=1 Tax=Burkholderia anthina TaxID=179879 RepID=UPI0037BF8EAC
MTHVFPYINTFTGFFVWLVVVLNIGTLCALIYKIVRYSELDVFGFVLCLEGLVAFNLLVCAFLLFHSSLLDLRLTGAFWSRFFSMLLWYYIMKFVLFINVSLTITVMWSVGTLRPRRVTAR